MPFKLAVFSDEVSQDLSRAIAVANDFGLDGLEIRSVWDKGADKLTVADAHNIITQMGDAGLQVSALSTPFLKCPISDDGAIRQHLDLLKRCLDVAETLGTSMLRIFTFWRMEDPESHWPAIVELLREQVLPIVENCPVTLAIENEASTTIGSGDELHRFLQLLCVPAIRGLWDPCNILFLGPDYTIYPDEYESCKDDIVHVHLKDAVWNGSTNAAECVILGEGIIRIADQLERLHRDGYRDWLALETHWRPTQLTEAEMNLPGGSNFSKDGEYASRICLERLKAMLAEKGIE